MKTLELNNGISIPILGLGTYKIGRTEEDVYRAVRNGIEIGYRHIDTATLYLNEKPVGKAIRESGIAREEIFVTTKLWGSDILNNRIQETFEGSLKNLGLDYIDMYLIHWPVKGMVSSSWGEMENIYQSGRTKAIGVSNHLNHHLEEILKNSSIIPVVNQMELHPYLIQEDVVEYCKNNNITPEAWSPLGSSKVPLLKEDLLINIGHKYGKSSAQVVLRWNIQKSIISIPKSSNKERQKENFDIFDFELTHEEINQIDSLNKNHRIGTHPDHIEF